jgi:uncharacterized protein DUF3311
MPNETRGASTSARAFTYGLFLIIVVVTLWVPLYNRVEPSLGGIPFFYWFQIAWIVVTAIATVIAYKLKV